MRLKRLMVVPALAGLLVVGVLGFVPMQTFAQGPTPTAQTCDSQANDTTDVTSTGADADNVDLQCGDQSTSDANAAEVNAAGTDTDNVQQGGGQQVEDGQPDVQGAVESPDVN